MTHCKLTPVLQRLMLQQSMICYAKERMFSLAIVFTERLCRVDP
jgi:hypothetical protein